MLERVGVEHTLRQFRATDFSAEEAARALRVPFASIVKTIVVRGDRTGVMRVCLTGPTRLSLQKLARVSGNKRVELVASEELRRLTGYLRGGVSPLGGRGKHPVYCDASVLGAPRVLVNAGMRGVQIELDPKDLVRAADAAVADLTEDDDAGETTAAPYR